MAFLIPLLLALLVGAVDVGRAFYSYIAITNAAREGVRRGVQLPSPMLSGGIAEIEAAVNQEVSSYGIDTDLLTIDVDADAARGSIVVTTTYPVHLILGGVAGLPEDLVVRDAAEMLWFVDT